MQRASRAVVTPWNERLERLRPRAIDVGLGIMVSVGVTIAISEASLPDTRPPDAFAYALGVTFGVLVLGRRRWPIGVLLASFITLQIYYWANYPGLWPAVPLSVALYTAAAAGHLRWSLGVAAFFLFPTLFFTVSGIVGPAVSLNEWVRDSALLVAVVLLGDGVRSHRALAVEAAERLRRAEEDRERERQELRAAQVIQRQLLPKELPSLSGWRVAAYYRPAREVGGDFYDFIELPEGQVAIVIGDVTDKGIPAALIMSTTHSILQGDAPQLVSPAAVLQRANDRLYPHIPAQMFVTCLYAVLDPASGRLRYANAGHNLPCVATEGGVRELRATGMPLGAMPGMTYEENEAYVAPGDTILLHSDGLIEAHNPAGEMFGFPRLQQVVATSNGCDHLIDECLTALRAFVGGDWDQEDDITFVTLRRDRR